MALNRLRTVVSVLLILGLLLGAGSVWTGRFVRAEPAKRKPPPSGAAEQQVKAAEANLEVAKAQVEVAKAQIEEAEAIVQVAPVEEEYRRLQSVRFEKLFEKNAVGKDVAEEAQAAYRRAKREKIVKQIGVRIAKARLKVAEAQVKAAEAQLAATRSGTPE